jgi:hypothetical protein
MSRKAAHSRWFDKTRPAPDWLHLHLTNEDIRNLLRYHDRNTRWRLLYYRDLWNAIPPWADKAKIHAVYAEAHRRRLAGEDVQVDHIIPLHGKLVCGLHTQANLCVMDRKLNAQIGNKVYPGAPQLQLFSDHNPYFELESQ